MFVQQVQKIYHLANGANTSSRILNIFLRSTWIFSKNFFRLLIETPKEFSFQTTTTTDSSLTLTISTSNHPNSQNNPEPNHHLHHLHPLHTPHHQQVNTTIIHTNSLVLFPKTKPKKKLSKTTRWAYPGSARRSRESRSSWARRTGTQRPQQQAGLARYWIRTGRRSGFKLAPRRCVVVEFSPSTPPPPAAAMGRVIFIIISVAVTQG